MNDRRRRAPWLLTCATLIAVVIACGGGTSGGAGSESDLWDQLQRSKELRVAMVLQFPPQFYRDQNTREPAGYDVEMLKLMSRDLGVTLKIEDMDFTGTVPALLSGRVDLIANGLVNTPERAKTIQFSDPYVPYELVLLVPRGSAVKDVAGLNQRGRIVAALLGSTSEQLSKQLFPNAEVRGLQHQDACMLEVASKKADACMMEKYLAIPFVRNNPQTTELLATAKPLALQYGCLAVRYGSPRFLYWLNNWLKFYQANGVLDALYNRIIGPTLQL